LARAGGVVPAGAGGDVSLALGTAGAAADGTGGVLPALGTGRVLPLGEPGRPDGAAADGAGGVPPAPGTGRAFPLGEPGWPDGAVADGALAGVTLAGAGDTPVLAALIDALGGTGSLPC
jgi:hypothetical protein